jgi:hypothetical protein
MTHRDTGLRWVHHNWTQFWVTPVAIAQLTSKAVVPVTRVPLLLPTTACSSRRESPGNITATVCEGSVRGPQWRCNFWGGGLMRVSGRPL